jgi:hypothetical protein
MGEEREKLKGKNRRIINKRRRIMVAHSGEMNGNEDSSGRAGKVRLKDGGGA